MYNTHTVPVLMLLVVVLETVGAAAETYLHRSTRGGVYRTTLRSDIENIDDRAADVTLAMMLMVQLGGGCSCNGCDRLGPLAAVVFLSLAVLLLKLGLTQVIDDASAV